MYSNMGELGKVKLTAAQKAQVREARASAAVQKKLAKVAARTAKREYKVALQSAKRAAKLAKYAPTPSAEVVGASQTSPVIPSPTDLQSFGAQQPAMFAPSSGGGGGAPSAAPDMQPESPVTADGEAPNYTPWIVGGLGVLAFLFLRKKH